MAQLTAQLPTTEKFYFRADSGYFSGDLLSFLEDNDYEYLIKVKMKNLTTMLASQDWADIEIKQAGRKPLLNMDVKAGILKEHLRLSELKFPKKTQRRHYWK